MADIRCPNCGQENPDFLDNCQFCQSPLPPSDWKIHIGEEPTPKSTGELEPILPDWLREIRQQEMDKAEDEILIPPPKPKVQQEPPDLLAGLMSQSESEEEELPDWLKGIAPSLKKEEPASPPAAQPSPPPFFGETQPSAEPASTGAPAEPSADKLAAWFAEDFNQPASQETGSAPADDDWLKNLAAFTVPEEPAPAQPASGEDLGWLRDLEAAAKGAEEPAAPAASEEDLDWLNKLGAASQEPAPAQPASGEDLGWLTNLSAVTEPPTEPAPAQPASSEDLDWLKNIGASEPAQPSAPAFAEPAETKEPPASPKPFQTAPLNELLGDETLRDATPDWLKAALEEPTMPAPGDLSDWFARQEPPSKETLPTPPSPGAPTPAFDLPASDSSLPDLDALFNVEMPDWLSGEPEKPAAPSPETASAPSFTEEGEALAPAELPSWVQAMRPVESAISGTPSTTDMVTEREGPLAGFRGVIPLSPIGSALRPKPFSLKLQASEEQQAAAALLEHLIESETAAKPSQPATKAAAPHTLRWALSALFLLVLSAVLWLGLRSLYIPPSSRLSDLISALPDASPVLIVIDYDPAFAGELEAAAGPLLDQLALSKHSTFEFIAASPTASGLVERLMRNTNLSKPFPSGLGYRPAEHYFNLGYLPGGAAGAAGFIGDPQTFSRYAAIALLTDNVESSRIWIEQLEAAGPQVSAKPLIVVASAQAAPMLQPYAASGQAQLVVNGLYDAAKYEALNVSRPGTVRTYWDALGFGLMMAIVAIFIGGVWNLSLRLREQRNAMKQG